LSGKSTNTLQIITYFVLSGPHGFVRGLSTCTNLLECLNDWTSNTQEGCQTIAIYIDFSKAFDVVQHDKLFCKLRACGVDGLLLQWITNSFSNRTFCSRANEMLAGVAKLISDSRQCYWTSDFLNIYQ